MADAMVKFQYETITAGETQHTAYVVLCPRVKSYLDDDEQGYPHPGKFVSTTPG